MAHIETNPTTAGSANLIRAGIGPPCLCLSVSPISRTQEQVATTQDEARRRTPSTYRREESEHHSRREANELPIVRILPGLWVEREPLARIFFPGTSKLGEPRSQRGGLRGDSKTDFQGWATFSWRQYPRFSTTTVHCRPFSPLPQKRPGLQDQFHDQGCSWLLLLMLLLPLLLAAKGGSSGRQRREGGKAGGQGRGKKNGHV